MTAVKKTAAPKKKAAAKKKAAPKSKAVHKKKPAAKKKTVARKPLTKTKAAQLEKTKPLSESTRRKHPAPTGPLWERPDDVGPKRIPGSVSRALHKIATKKATTRKAAPKRKPVAKKKATKRKPNAAFMRPLALSADLGAVVGSKPIPRTQVTKKIWEYIKKNKLQDATNRRMIVADDKLKKVFGGKKKVSMFDMSKLISKHVK